MRVGQLSSLPERMRTCRVATHQMGVDPIQTWVSIAALRVRAGEEGAADNRTLGVRILGSCRLFRIVAVRRSRTARMAADHVRIRHADPGDLAAHQMRIVQSTPFCMAAHQKLIVLSAPFRMAAQQRRIDRSAPFCMAAHQVRIGRSAPWFGVRADPM